MIKQVLILLMALIGTTVLASCQGNVNKDPIKDLIVDEFSFLNQVIQSKEFKEEEKRTDSLKLKSGIPLELTISIIEKSPFPDDSSKNVSVGFINLDRGPDHLILYTLKYDNTKKEIISIDKKDIGENNMQLGSLDDPVISN